MRHVAVLVVLTWLCMAPSSALAGNYTDQEYLTCLHIESLTQQGGVCDDGVERFWWVSASVDDRVHVVGNARGTLVSGLTSYAPRKQRYEDVLFAMFTQPGMYQQSANLGNADRLWSSFVDAADVLHTP